MAHIININTDIMLLFTKYLKPILQGLFMRISWRDASAPSGSPYPTISNTTRSVISQTSGPRASTSTSWARWSTRKSTRRSMETCGRAWYFQPTVPLSANLRAAASISLGKMNLFDIVRSGAPLHYNSGCHNVTGLNFSKTITQPLINQDITQNYFLTTTWH